MGDPVVEPQRSVMSENNNSWCIGRFRLTSTPPLKLAGRSQSIYRVDACTIPLTSQSADALWSEKLTRIRSLTPPRGVSQTIIRTFELSSGVRAVWFFPSSTLTSVHRLEAMKPTMDHALEAGFNAEPGKESLAEQLLVNVINAYVPGTEHGFCIGQGSITSEPGVSEQALASFVHRELSEFRVSFDTHTVREPATQHPLSDIAIEQSEFAAAGGNLIVLRDAQRTVADIPGREGRVSVVSPGEAPFVRFTWHFPGVGQRSDLPEILIDGFAPTEQQATLEMAWEGMLQSVRRVPLSPRRSP